MRTLAGFIIAYAFLSTAQAGLPIKKGSAHRDFEGFSVSQRAIVWGLEDVALDRGVSSIRSIVAYAELPEEERFLVLDRSLTLAKIDTNTKSVFGPWRLDRWDRQYFFSEVIERYKSLGVEYPIDIHNEVFAPGIGCLARKPLRYGDIWGNGEHDLLIVLNDLIFIFSLGHKKVVFSEYLGASDWLTEEEMRHVYSDERGDLKHQYASRLMAGNNSYANALRAYSKIYFGDFDQDDNPDIVVWRKLYKSNETGASVRGFSKERDVYQHFERSSTAQKEPNLKVAGEFLPQETGRHTIIEWLKNGELTWRKGYPTQSECSGREGQLIQDSHDPLLNDPDVFQ